MEELQAKIESLESKVNQLEDKLSQDHAHTGYDYSQVLWADVSTKKFYIYHTLPGTSSATAALYGSFFIAAFKCVVVGMKEVHRVAGSDGGAVTLQLEKLVGTEAPGSGDALLSTALSLKTTAETVQSGVIIPVPKTKTLGIGDRLCLKDAGTLTAVDNVTVIIELNML